MVVLVEVAGGAAKVAVFVALPKLGKVSVEAGFAVLVVPNMDRGCCCCCWSWCCCCCGWPRPAKTLDPVPAAVLLLLAVLLAIRKEEKTLAGAVVALLYAAGAPNMLGAAAAADVLLEALPRPEKKPGMTTQILKFLFESIKSTMTMTGGDWIYLLRFLLLAKSKEAQGKACQKKRLGNTRLMWLIVAGVAVHMFIKQVHMYTTMYILHIYVSVGVCTYSVHTAVKITINEAAMLGW